MTDDKYKDTYRIPSARWQDWDYGTGAAYYVTICTAHREHYFGEITDGEMQRSAIGQAVESEWLKAPELRPDMNLMLDRYVVMPNHFHGIIVIGGNRHNTDSVQPAPAKFAPQSHNLGAIIRGFKSAVTKFANINNIPFAWQSRFHDRVIRDYAEFARVAQYIDENITNWIDDELYET